MESRGYGRSDKGRRTPRNEDSYALDDGLQAYLVCNGMGGHPHGDLASRLARDAALQALHAKRDAIATIQAGQAPAVELEKIAEATLQHACAAVWEAAAKDSGRAGMGTTMTLLLVGGTRAVMAHVGDARLYLCRAGEVHQLSSDHTITAELLAGGAITPAEATAHPFARALTRALGIQPTVRVDTLTIDVLPGDRFLLCTAGVWSSVTDPTWLAETLGREPDEATTALLARADALDGRGDATAVVVAVSDDADAAAEDTARRVLLSLDALGSMFLFDGLDLARLSRVLDACRLAIYRDGEAVLEEGERCDRLIVFVDGAFQLLRGGEVIGSLGPGDHLGETTLLSPRAARVGVRSEGGGSALHLSRRSFSRLVKRRPQLGAALLARLGTHLSHELDIARAGAAVTPSDAF